MSRKLLILPCLFLGVASNALELSAAPPPPPIVGPQSAVARRVARSNIGDLATAAVAAPAQKIHALLIGSERDATIGRGVGASGIKLYGMLQGTFGSQVEITTVGFVSPQLTQPGNSVFDVVTLNRVLNQLRSSVQSEDVVFCYVMAHGAFDSAHFAPQFENGQWFQTDRREPYPRVNLVEGLQNLGARLTVVVSDSCNVRVDAPALAARPSVASADLVTHPALIALFGNYEGMVSLSASSPGEFSFYYDTIGGLFTDTFVGMAANDHAFTWRDFEDQLRTETNRRFGVLIGQYQDPQTGRIQTSLTPTLMRPENYVRPLTASGTAATVPATSAPAKATPENAIPEKAAPEKAAPEKAAPEKAAPEKAAPEKAAPEKTTPDEAPKPTT